MYTYRDIVRYIYPITHLIRAIRKSGFGAYAHSKGPGQSAHLYSLILDWNVCLLDPAIPNDYVSGAAKPWSDCAKAQPDQALLRPPTPEGPFSNDEVQTFISFVR